MRKHVLKEPRICGVDFLLLLIIIVDVLLSCVGLSVRALWCVEGRKCCLWP